MRLNLREIIHVPGASLPFQFPWISVGRDFFGEHPITHPVTVTGSVKNVADVLGAGGGSPFPSGGDLRPLHGPLYPGGKRSPCSFCWRESLENEEDDDIVLLEDGEVDVGQLAYTAFILNMDTKHLCSEDCKGLCPGCGRQPQCGALPVSEAGRSQMGRSRAAA